MPEAQTPKQMAMALLTNLATMEANIKKPFTAAGAPELPTPAQMALQLVQALPDMPAFAQLLPTQLLPGAAAPEAARKEEVATREGYRKMM